jgi:DNA-binding SARP family transcriptional activator
VEQIKISLLGPLGITMGVKDATPSAQKQRQVLSMLLVHDSSVVPVSALIEELWSETPPKSSLTVIQTYALGIRKRIANNFDLTQEEVSAKLLQTRSKGYSFDTSSCEVDLYSYRSLVESGTKAVVDGNDREAARLLRAADALWTGPALVDVERGLPLEVEATRLDQSRLAAIQLRIEAELRLGRYRDVCTDLAGLVLRYQFHEQLHAYYMFSLCLAGWRSRALEVFQQLRNSMIEELGVEPCAQVQKLHRHILAASEDSVYADLSREQASYLMGLYRPGNPYHRARVIQDPRLGQAEGGLVRQVGHGMLRTARRNEEQVCRAAG